LRVDLGGRREAKNNNIVVYEARRETTVRLVTAQYPGLCSE
jgi:hypothetical protein